MRWAWLLGLVACTSATRAPAPAPPPRAHFTITPLPEADDPFRLGGGGYVAGAWRATRSEGGEVRWSEDAMPDRIEGVWHVAGRWVFVSRDGVMARAPELLARLERAGELPLPIETVEGDVPWIIGGDRLFSFASGQAVALLDRGVVSAIALDAQVAFVLIDGGGVVRTGNGGKTFAPVAVEAASDLELSNGKLYISTDTDLFEVSREGRLTRREHMDDDPTPIFERTPPDLRAVERDGHRMLVWRSGVVALPAPGGTMLVNERVVDRATGRVVRELEQPEGCLPRRWGDTTAFVCFRGIVQVLQPSFNVARAFDAGDGGIALSRDGRRAAVLGADVRLWNGVAWRRLEVSGVSGGVLAGERLAAVVDGDLLLIDLDTGGVRQEPLEPSHPRNLAKRAAADGTLVFSARRERSGPTAVAMRAPDGTMTYGELPEKVRPMFGPDLYVLDEHLGLAVGMSFRDTAITEDGGKTWVRVADADPWLDALAWPHVGNGDGTYGASCDDDACVVSMHGQDLVLRARGETRFSRDRIVAPRTDLPEERRAAAMPTFVCTGSPPGGALDEFSVPLVPGMSVRCKVGDHDHECVVERTVRGKVTRQPARGLLDGEVQDVLPVEGGALVHSSSQFMSANADHLVLLRVDGTVASRRTFAWAPHRHDQRRVRGLAVHKGVPGLAVQERWAEDRWQFWPFAGGPPVAMPAARVDAPACTSPPVAGATELRLAGGAPKEIHNRTAPPLRVEGTAEGTTAQIIYEVSERGACWRMMRAGPATLDASGRGELAGKPLECKRN